MNNIARIQEKLIANNLDAILITDEKNQRYATGFPFTDGSVLVSREKAWLFTDSRYIEAAEAAARQLAEAERLKKEQEEAAAATPVSAPAPETTDFTANNKNNIWDSIEKPQPEEDLDIPPSLRSRLKR